jgi:hypothetical protein
MVMILNTQASNELTPITHVVGVNGLWWANNVVLVADVNLQSAGPQNEAQRLLIWFDSNTGQEIGRFEASASPNQVIDFPGPLTGGEAVGFFAVDGFYVLDTATGTVLKKADFAEMGPWIVSPISFQGEGSCGP